MGNTQRPVRSFHMSLTAVVTAPSLDLECWGDNLACRTPLVPHRCCWVLSPVPSERGEPAHESGRSPHVHLSIHTSDSLECSNVGQA